MRHDTLNLTLTSIAFLLLAGQLPAAPSGPGGVMAASAYAPTRVIQANFHAGFPKVLQVLIQNGYLVRSANENIGLVSFAFQFVDEYGRDTIREGSIIFSSEGPNSTRVWLKLTETWRKVEATGSSLVPVIHVLVGGIREDSEPMEYKKVLDLVEKSLVPATAQH